MSRAWIRHGSALLIIAFLLAVTVIGYQRTRNSGSAIGSVDPQEVGINVADTAIGLYRGFQHTETLNGQPLFVLNSLRTLSRASGRQEIEGVRLQFFRDGNDGPILTAETASFNIETRDAQLEGGIHVEFPNGAFLNTEAGTFRSKQQVFESDAPVLYVDGPTYGSAQRASYDLGRNVVRLEGNAAFRSENGVMLVAPSMVYRRDEQKVAFADGVEFTQGFSRLTAPRGTVLLGSSDGPPERIELIGGVDLRTTVASSGALVNMWAERVVLEQDARGRWQVRARTTGPWVEVRFTGGPDYFERTLRTLFLSAVVSEEGIVSMFCDDGVCLDEIPMEGPRRSGQAQSARAWFSNGQLTDVEMDGQVEIQAGDVFARGTRARLVQLNGLVMLQGDATGRSRVGVVSERGKMSCDQATLFDREGRIEARGQVQGELWNAHLLGAETTGGEDEPVRFAGETLDVTDDGTTFSLRDNARVWQGHRLVLADGIIFRNEAQSVEARGHVRVTFPPEDVDETTVGEDDVVVVARSLDYGTSVDRAVFRGSVKYTDPKHSLTANRLTIAFDDQNAISDVEAEGAVEIQDLELGRRLTGQYAKRQVATGVITVTGAPAQLIDERGNVASGESLTWNQADGTVSIGGGTEFVYYPEEQP